MERAKDILNSSLLWRWLMALCAWCGEQWSGSAVVQWFLHPRGWSRGASENSVFYKLWTLVRSGLCRGYELLRLDVLFAGSVFTQTWFWSMMPAVFAPLFARVFRITEPVAEGLAIGACSHALGTTRAIEIGSVQGAMSSIAICVCGIITSLLALFL